MNIWLIVYLAIVLVVLALLWAVQFLATTRPHDEFMKERAKNEQWARKQLDGRSTM
jgi:hypothetical protein